jgi:hypothetical protein
MRQMWPGWDDRGRTRVSWVVVDYAAADDSLMCEYTGKSQHNRALIGPGGLYQFSLAHQFYSGDTIEALIGEPASTRSYVQIRAKRFQCYLESGEQPEPTTNVSQFTDLSRCKYCKTQLFEGEVSDLCCHNGKFMLRSRADNPPELEILLDNPAFAQCARVVNNMFSMTSIGTTREGFEANPAAQFVNFNRGRGSVRLHGASYHRCLPGNAHGGIEYYLYDKQYEAARAKMRDDVPADDLDGLRRMLLRENRFARAIRSMGDVDGPTATLVLRHNVTISTFPPFRLPGRRDLGAHRRLHLLHGRRHIQHEILQPLAQHIDVVTSS